MVVFFYDKTFEGLLTCVFEAYWLKRFPDNLLNENEIPPLFSNEQYHIYSDKTKAERVWKGLEKKLSQSALNEIATCWFADSYEKVDELLFRYIRKAIDAPQSIELNFGDADVLELQRVWKQVKWERTRVMQFARFQKASDGTYFAPFEPVHNVLPLAVAHFKDRFADQKFLLFDMKRHYGLYYDLHSVEEITFSDEESNLGNGKLDINALAEDEILFQNLWKTYFKAICIKERMNPRKHKQDMPVRYWKYLTEKG